ncbi:MAG: class I SAM-dependent methyltransferase [Gemmatimonadota bacterium]
MTDAPRPTASSSSTDATRIWEESEADAWFHRNAETLARWSPDSDPLVRMLGRYGLTARSVLEVGSSSGFRVAYMAEAFRQNGSEQELEADDFVGVDPSAAAVAEGTRRFPGIRMLKGVAHQLPVERMFQLVMVNYVLHWIPRTLLLASVSEIDRCLLDGGYLLLGDFLPAVPTRVDYHHLPDPVIHTWKQDYGALFQATGIYRLLARLELDHATNQPMAAIPPANRGAVWLLQKELREGYQESPPKR